MIAAICQPDVVIANMVKEGVMIIDVGKTGVDDSSRARGWRLKGNVDFDNVAPKYSYITPDLGGVGPMTIASLMINTFKAMELKGKSQLNSKIKMKSLLGLAAAAMLLLASCATSNEVNGGGILQKRKYTKGFYWNKGISANESASVLKSEKLKTEEVNSFNSFNNEYTSENAISSISLNSNQSANLAQETEKSLSFSRKFHVNSTNSIKSKSTVEWTPNPLKKIAESQSKSVKEAVGRSKAPSGGGNFGYILGIILMSLLVVLLFKLLEEGLVSGILGLGIAVLLIILLLLLRLSGMS